MTTRRPRAESANGEEEANEQEAQPAIASGEEEPETVCEFGCVKLPRLTTVVSMSEEEKKKYADKEKCSYAKCGKIFFTSLPPEMAVN